MGYTNGIIYTPKYRVAALLIIYIIMIIYSVNVYINYAYYSQMP